MTERASSRLGGDTRPLAGLTSLDAPDDAMAMLRREVLRLADEVRELRAENADLRRALGSPAPGPEPAALPPAPAAVPPAPVRDLATSPPPAPFTPPPLPSVGLAGPAQGIDFGAVAQLTPDKLDGLPYGLITLDARGRVIHYNDTESRLVGLPKDRVIGRNFFREIAPCTRIREFEGRFIELAADPIGVRVQSFDFIFKFARGEQHVSVVMTPGRVRGQFHLALLRRARPG